MRGGGLLACLAAAFSLMSWLLPNHYFPWVSFYQDFSAFLLLLVVLGWVVSFYRLSFSWSVLFLLGVACVPIIQWVVGLVFWRGDALIAGLYIVAAAMAVAVGRNLYVCMGRGVVEFAAWVVVFGGVISVWIALVQWLSLVGSVFIVDLPSGWRPYANMAQPNNLATFLCMGVASILYLWERSRIGAWSAGILAAFIVVGLVLSQSRTSWLAAIFLLIWWHWCGGRAALHMSMQTLFMWVATYAVLVCSYPWVAELLYLPFIGLQERAQGLHRLDLWLQLGQAVLSGGWWGYGWNQVSVAQVSVSLEYPVPLLVEHSHNFFLDVLIWNGPLIGLIIIGFIIFWGVGLIRRVDTLESTYLLMVVGFVLLHAMLEFPLEYAFFLIPVCMFLGMVELDQENVEVLMLPRWVGGAVFIFGLAVMGSVWREYRVVENDYRLMRFETARIGHLQSKLDDSSMALLDQVQGFLTFARTEAALGMSDAELDWMRRVAHRYPYPPSILRYALALSLSGYPEQSVVEMKRLRSLHGDELYEEARLSMISMKEKYPEVIFYELPE